jgi:hypothetical protein
LPRAAARQRMLGATAQKVTPMSVSARVVNTLQTPPRRAMS